MSINDDKLIEPINKLLLPIASAAGQTLQDVWELIFGGLSVYVEKKRIARQNSIDSFKKSLIKNITSIPEDNLQEPPLSIIGPALEASKYYFEEPELREMFAKLIASSMDKEKISKVHPSFTEIIKQLSPLDAQNLTFFHPKTLLPIAEYKLHLSDNKYLTLQKDAFTTNTSQTDIPMQAYSLSSLSRLGLIEKRYDIVLFPKTIYNKFFQIDFYHNLVKNFCNTPEKKEQIQIIKGVVSLTSLGENFKAICQP